jgi:ABC-type glutathione transport system ATPase component
LATYPPPSSSASKRPTPTPCCAGPSACSPPRPWKRAIDPNALFELSKFALAELDHGNRKDGQLWALRDVSFQVRKGEILGIIGRNGAGKSTLLKILSRITAPTSGQVKIKGRVGSLLEDRLIRADTRHGTAKRATH